MKTTAIVKSIFPSQCACTAPWTRTASQAPTDCCQSSMAHRSTRQTPCQIPTFQTTPSVLSSMTCIFTATRTLSRAFFTSSIRPILQSRTSITWHASELQARFSISRSTMTARSRASSRLPTMLPAPWIMDSMPASEFKDVSLIDRISIINRTFTNRLTADPATGPQQGYGYSFQSASITPGLSIVCNTLSNTCSTLSS